MSNWKRFVFATDIHGDMQDKAANDALMGFCADFQPEIRICGGDWMDCRPLRRGAGDEEKAEGMSSDWEAAKEWAERFNPTHMLEGNHDYRLVRLAENGSGILREWAKSRREEIRQLFEGLECKTQPYDVRRGVLKIGTLSFIHGYTHGVNCLREPILSYGNVIQGHVHYPSYNARMGFEGWTSPCLCNLEMEYASTKLGSLSWRNGWIWGEVSDSGHDVHTVIGNNGQYRW